MTLRRKDLFNDAFNFSKRLIYFAIYAGVCEKSYPLTTCGKWQLSTNVKNVKKWLTL